MPTANDLIPTAEAAFIAGLTDRHMNRVVDEELVPRRLFERKGSARRFTRLCAAFAHFYFDTEDLLIASARRQVLDELMQRVEGYGRLREVLALTALPDELDWKFAKHAVEIDLKPYLREAAARAKQVDQADALIVTDPEVMGGVPVFAGTRVPVDIVLASVGAGIARDRLQASYPFLTDEHLQAARVYQTVHPRRGRPRRWSEVDPAVRRRETRVVRPARA